MGYRIQNKQILNSTVTKMDIYAPDIAAKAKAGQFIILRVCHDGERIPLTIADTNKKDGLVSIIFQIVGLTTSKLNELNIGDEILDFAGPLGKESELNGYSNVLVVGGGVGSAIAYPICKALCENGAQTSVVLGFRNKDLIILEEEFKKITNDFNVYTDDGSYGEKGFVTDGIKALLEAGNKYDVIYCIGPLIMMKNVCKLTKEYNIKIIVSMNPIMIDGTGMCGCCRLLVDGKLKFACVDGPDFDGHLVNFEEMMNRNRIYHDEEKIKLENYKREKDCNLLKGKKNE